MINSLKLIMFFIIAIIFILCIIPSILINFEPQIYILCLGFLLLIVYSIFILKEN